MKFSTHFVILIIVFLVFLATFVNAADPSLRAWYKFDESSGSTASDSSGNGYDATLSSSSKWKSCGAISGCLSNDNAWGTFIGNVPAGAFDTIDNKITISTWIYTTENCETYGYASLLNAKAPSAGKDAILSLGIYDDGSTPANHYIVSVTGENSAGESTTNWWWNYNTVDQAHFEQWHHLAMVKDTEQLIEKLYYDGIEVASYSCDPAKTMEGIEEFSFFARVTTNPSWYDSFHGKMDDFRIYDRSLNAEEIWFLANPADLTGDKMVDIDDVQLLTYDWLDNSSGDSDINKDGIVNFKDYAFLLNKWHESGEYYFDSITGDDNNTGTSPEQAWQSLGKFNSLIFLPGDHIYFKAGSQWDGSIQPKGSGTAENPIIIDAYGDTYEQEVKPCINGEGNVGAALSIENVQYWEINNLQITNQGATRAAWRKGVSINASNFGTMRHIQLKNLYVHNVNGLIEKENGGGCGISWFCSGDTVPTKFDGILIEGCYIKTTDRDGIVGGNTKIGMNTTDPRDSSDWYPSVNVVIRGNLLEDIGGDGIVPVGTDGCIVEYNVINGGSCRTYNNTPTQFAAGIWPWSADNTILQYNEVSGMKGTSDGQGYDCDYNCQNTLFQYNYSHDNEGGFMLVCDNDDGVGDINPIVRYNISQNDQERIFHLGAGAQIYNNVIYNGSGSDVHLVKNFAGCTGKSYFSNNIFMSLGTYRFDFNAMKTSMNSFSNNCWVANSWKKEILWYGSTVYSSGRPSGTNDITSDPKFINPGSGVDGYKLQSTSPCINAGKIISNNGGYDFWGNILYNGNPDVGAEEH